MRQGDEVEARLAREARSIFQVLEDPKGAADALGEEARAVLDREPGAARALVERTLDDARAVLRDFGNMSSAMASAYTAAAASTAASLISAS